MKTMINKLVLALAFVVMPVTVLTACKSTPQQAAYKTLKSVQLASVTALDIYGKAYQRGEVTPEVRAKVQSLYVKYQAAFRVAEAAAQFNYESPSPQELTTALSDLVQLVQTLKR